MFDSLSDKLQKVLDRLTRVHGEGTKVAIYPTAALQHEPMELKIESNL